MTQEVLITFLETASGEDGGFYVVVDEVTAQSVEEAFIKYQKHYDPDPDHADHYKCVHVSQFDNTYGFVIHVTSDGWFGNHLYTGAIYTTYHKTSAFITV
jgi:hypothetical protein